MRVYGLSTFGRSGMLASIDFRGHCYEDDIVEPESTSPTEMDLAEIEAEEAEAELLRTPRPTRLKIGSRLA